MQSDVDDGVIYLDQERQAGTASAVTSVDADPEKAARAIQLGRASGVDPSIIHEDVEGFEAQHRAALTHDILRNNPYLQSYAASDPMAAKVSADDWGHLDEISKVLDKVGPVGMMRKAVEGFKEGFGPGPSGQWAEQVRSEDEKFAQEHPELYDFIKRGTVALGEPLELFARLFSGALKGVQAGGQEALEQLGMDRSEAKRAARDMTAAIEMQVTSQPHAPFGQLHTAKLGAKQLPAPKPPEIAPEALEAARLAMPYIKAGEEPPTGLHPLIDKLKMEQSEIDLKNLDELVKESQKSATRERSPEHYEKFVEQKVQGNIGISAEKVAELYKDKMPEPDDGLLGWIPDLVDQMNVALATGGDIEVSTAKWAAYVDREVAKALHDFIRPRKGGVTLAEGEILQERTKVKEEQQKQTETKTEELPHDETVDWQTEPLVNLPFEAGKYVDDNVFMGAHSGKLIQITDEGKRYQYSVTSGSKVGPGGVSIRKDIGRVDYAGDLKKKLQEVGELKAKEEELSQKFSQEAKPVEEVGPVAPEQGVRQAAGLKPLFEEAIRQEQTAREGEWVPIGKAAEGFVPEKFTEFETAVAGIVEEELARIVPKKVDVQFAGDLRKTGAKKPDIGGIYTQYSKQLPTITLALAHDLDIPGVGRHEAIHHLRAYGFFSEAEWKTLTDAARDEDWISKERGGKKSSIADKYGSKGLDAEQLLEEAIADEFRYWNRNPDHPTLAATVFEKLREFLQNLKAKWDELATQNPDVQNIFKMIESGEIGRREGTKPLHPKAFDQFAEKGQGELDVTRQQDRKLFATIAGWMNKADQAYYMDLLAKRAQEDAAFQLKKAERFERKRQSEEWRAAEQEMRPQVEADISNRPDVGVLEYLRAGKLYGEETGTRPRVDPTLLTEEQRKAFPEKYQRRDGMDPNDLANLFGYKTFDDLAARLTALDAALGNNTTSQFLKGLVDAELAQRMAEKFGDKAENILREAQEHVLSPTQMDLLHEELIGFGWKKELDVPFTKAEMKAWAADTFEKAPAVKVSSANYFQSMGRAWRQVELAMQEGNVPAILKFKQEQLRAAYMADEAIKFEKEQERFDRFAKKFGKREVEGIEQVYTNYIQQLLAKAGETVRNSPEEVARAIEFEGYGTLDNFVDRMNSTGWDIQVPESYSPKTLDKMTVREFRELQDAVESLAHVGREERKINVAGEAEDRAAFRERVIGTISQLPKRDIAAMEKGGRWLYKLDASFTRMEEIIKDLDLRQELGPLFGALIQPFETAKAHKFEMVEALTKRLKEIKGFDKAWRKTLEEEIPHNFVFDSYNQVPFKLTRWNMVKMMLNMGNEGNFTKLARGIASAERGKIAGPAETAAMRSKIEALVHQHAKEEDWNFVQNVWDIFRDWQGEADRVIRTTAGKVPKWVENTPIETPFGTKAGGYFPLIPDRLRPVGQGLREHVVDTDALMGPNYYRATTSRPHHLDRTGATYFVDITNGIENLAGRMQQHMHDIAFREFVVDAGKVIYDREIRAAIRKHYGVEYDAQLEPWLKRIANELTVPERELQGWNDVLKFFRLNLTAAALPLNYTVMLSPSIGTANLRSFLSFNSNRAANKKMMMEHSRELKHVLYSLDRDVTEQLSQITGERGWTSFQRQAVEGMYKPLVWMEQQARMNTFYGEFMAQKAKGLSDAQASMLADSIVRERHGAVSLGDLPSLMASKNEFVKVATVFMGWFSMIRNWNRQLPGQYRRGDWSGMAKTIWGTVLVSTLFNAALFTKRKEEEGTFHFLGRALLDTPMTMVPFIREGWSWYTESRRPTSPIFNMFVSVGNLLKDGIKAYEGKAVERPIRHMFDVTGQGIGLPGTVQIGRTGQFLYDANRGKQRPKDIVEWMRGIATGEAKLRKK